SQNNKYYPKEKRPISRNSKRQNYYVQQQQQITDKKKNNNEFFKKDTDSSVIMIDNHTIQLYQKIALTSLWANYKGTISCNSLSCLNDAQKPSRSLKSIHQQNSNNNNNNDNSHDNSLARTNQKWQQQMKFYVYDLSREKPINLIYDVDEEKLLLVNNVSENIYNYGIRNGLLQ
ncbi:unnamed protein product, partial [Didymodactylos carnosus]